MEINYGYSDSDIVPEIQEVSEPAPEKVEAKAEPKVEKPEAKVEAPKEEKVVEKPEAKVEPKVEKVETKIEEPKVEEKPAEVTAADWKKVLKSSNPDKYEVLKEMGYDDWTLDLLRYKEQTGDLTPYLEVKTVDYSKMTPEQIIKFDLQKKFPGMSEKAFNLKLKKELTDKYALDRTEFPEDSDEAILGQEELRFEAEKRRKEFIEEQKKFKAPEPQPDLDATRREAELQQQRASLGESVMNNAFTKSLQENKYVTFGEGEESFKFKVDDVQGLVNTALNAIVNSGYTDISKMDMETFYKQLIIGKDIKAYEKAFADNIRNVAKKKLQDELQNVTPLNNQQPEAPAPVRDYGYKG